jgi:alkylated DNA repair dioxygenase AlkB
LYLFLDGFIKAVFMTHYNLGDMLSVHEHNDDITVGSNIITASLGTDKLVSLSSPVIFTIQLSLISIYPKIS